MTDVPNPAQGVKSVGKGIKGKVTGHKPIVYVIMGVGVLAIAYYLRKRTQGTPLPTADASSAPVDPTLSGSYYPDPTQGAGASSGYSDPGAYGGYPTPDLSTFFDNLNNLLDTATQNAAAQGAQAAANVPAASPVVADTGGGAPVTPPIETKYVPPPAPAPTPPAPAYTPTPIPSGATTWGGPMYIPPPAPTSPYPGFPYHSDRGWYRLVLPPDGSRWHYYGPNNSPKIRVS